MFADEIRRAAEAAPRTKLPGVAAALWRAYGAGQVSEAEAETLSALIDARRALPAAPVAARRAVGSRPRTDTSMERRRRWVASGWLPPALAARFTMAEAAVLAVIAAEVVKRGDCRLCLEHIAAVAGVSRTTAKTAIRQARALGFITVEERRQTTWRNLPNIVRITNTTWTSWLHHARRERTMGGGVGTAPGTSTGSQIPGHSRGADQRPWSDSGGKIQRIVGNSVTNRRR